ncbi:cytochrome P450, partial [Arthrobacter deserti]|nr:cytochrome P450 [Arthrobacter deserti]
TIASIGNIVALFGRHPEQLELVRENPELVPAAFAEVLRYWAPVHIWGRTAVREVEIDGATVPAGAQLGILFGAGNRDPRHYENPDTFDVTRNPVDHLSFGYGPHGCAGQGLAKLEAHAIIDALARRVKVLATADEVRVPSNITRSFELLQVLKVVAA